MSGLNVIIIILLILLLLWIITRTFLITNIIYDKMLVANNQSNTESLTKIKSEDINAGNSCNFMLSVWFYIDDWSESIGQEKNILFLANSASDESAFGNNCSQLAKTIDESSLASTKTYRNLNIGLCNFQNNLFIDMQTYDPTDSSSNFTRYRIKNIPLQRWVNLTLSVESKTLDLYLDGKLKNSFILPGTYKNAILSEETHDMYLGNHNQSSTNIHGFEGFITRIRYEPNSINPQEAYNIYKDGINYSLARSIYNKYGLKVSFLENNRERGSFTI
jgi:hypothetical protein